MERRAVSDQIWDDARFASIYLYCDYTGRELMSEPLHRFDMKTPHG